MAQPKPLPPLLSLVTWPSRWRWLVGPCMFVIGLLLLLVPTRAEWNTPSRRSSAQWLLGDASYTESEPDNRVNVNLVLEHAGYPDGAHAVSGYWWATPYPGSSSLGPSVTFDDPPPAFDDLGLADTLRDLLHEQAEHADTSWPEIDPVLNGEFQAALAETPPSVRATATSRSRWSALLPHARWLLWPIMAGGVLVLSLQFLATRHASRTRKRIRQRHCGCCNYPIDAGSTCTECGCDQHLLYLALLAKTRRPPRSA